MAKTPRAWNSSLPRQTKPMNRGKGMKHGGRLKTRDFRTRKPGRYGPIWAAVKRLPCFLNALAPNLHPRCGLGYASGHTAHHVIPAGLDEEGAVPCCGLVHDVLERYKRRVVVDFISITGVKFEVDIHALGHAYVRRVQSQDSEGLEG